MATRSGLSTAYTYDAAGRITQVDYANGPKIVREYDSANRLTAIEHRDPNDAALLRLEYAWNLDNTVSQRTEIDHTVNPAQTTVVSFAYDQRARLTGETRVVSPSTTVYDLEYTYDRLGRRATVTDAAGTRTFAYDPNSLAVATESLDPNGLFGGLVITHEYAASTPVGRFTGLLVRKPNDPNDYYTAGYNYGLLGRLNHVTGPGLPGGGGYSGAWYSYAGGSDLVTRTRFEDSSDEILANAIREFEAERDLVVTVQGAWRTELDPNTPLEPNDPNNVSTYGYENNELGLRTEITYAGVAFSSPPSAITQTLGYNDRNELTGSSRTDDDVFDRTYAYDPIGNRTTATTAADPNDVTITYEANELNEYEETELSGAGSGLQRFTYDADGNVTVMYIAADMNCDSVLDNFDTNPFVVALQQGKAAYDAAYPNCNYYNGDINGDGTVNNFDINGFNNLLTGGSDALYVTHTWDAENRLVAWRPAADPPQAGARKAEYVYDYQGRRIEKQVWTYQSGDWVPTEHRKFVWSGWLMLLQLDGLSEDAVVRKYTWGLDLAGQSGPSRDREGVGMLEGAGGIGGLLAVSDVDDPNDANDPYGDFVYFYDANGNVGQLMDLNEPNAAAAVVASYEYDPYGNLIAQDGAYADENPIRWSTKYWDAESGLGYWGYRYYDPRLGRWISRDPIGELGGTALYAYSVNAPTEHYDSLGQRNDWGLGDCPKPQPTPPPPPSPGQICGSPPNANPTDQDCCNTARPTCGNGDGGGVICCNGRKVSCSFFQPNPNQPGDSILEACIIEHEGDHHDDVSCAGCPSGQICRPYWAPGKNGNNEECSAYWKEVNCLVSAQTTCLSLPRVPDQTACVKRVTGRIQQMCRGMKGNSNCKKFPAICHGYGITD